MSKAIRKDMKQAKSINLSEGGRCCGTGYNIKYLTFSFMVKSTNKIGAFSNRMEKIGFEKALKLLKDEDIIAEQITTDRHVQIRST